MSWEKQVTDTFCMEGVGTLLPNGGWCPLASHLRRAGWLAARALAQGTGLPAGPATGRPPVVYQGPL